MSWNDLWTFYRGCGSEEIRKQILGQVDLKEFLPHQSYRVQIEILEHAPMDVVMSFQPILSDKAQKALGISNRISPDDLEAISRILR